MKKHFPVRRLLASFTIPLLFLSGFSPASAEEEEILPPSAMIAQEMQNLPTGDFFQKELNAELKILNSDESAAIHQAMDEYVAPETSLLINKGRHFYYYEHLEPLPQQIYDLMYQIASDPLSPRNYALLLTETDPKSEEFSYDFFRAQLALTYDHPELFWLYNESEARVVFHSDLEKINGRYSVFLALAEPFGQYEEQMNEFNNAAQEFLADIDLSRSEYDIALQIHDKLIDLVTYDMPVCDGGMNEVGNLGHTAYGALVKDSWGNANHCVCDGYSLAYEYLLQQCGIDAIVLSGMGGMSRLDMGGHAWSMVKIDDVWYETDSTWDDAGTAEAQLKPSRSDYGYFMEALKDPDYRNKIQHFLFLISSDQMEHFVPEGDEYYYYLSDGTGYLSLVGECFHERFGAEGLIGLTDPYAGVVTLAPQAEYNYNL